MKLVGLTVTPRGFQLTHKRRYTQGKCENVTHISKMTIIIKKSICNKFMIKMRFACYINRAFQTFGKIFYTTNYSLPLYKLCRVHWAVTSSAKRFAHSCIRLSQSRSRSLLWWKELLSIKSPHLFVWVPPAPFEMVDDSYLKKRLSWRSDNFKNILLKNMGREKKNYFSDIWKEDKEKLI